MAVDNAENPTVGTEKVAYDPETSRYDLFECPDCDNIVLALGRSDPPMTCHNKPMERVTDVEMAVKPPDVKQVLLQAFGLPKPGLDIALFVISEGPRSANDVADALGYERSTITRYLNTLAEIGLLQKSQLNREEGGVVNVYHPVDLERLRRETLVGFYVWAGEAAARIEESNLAQQETLDGNEDRALPEVFWESFPDR
ncbi:MAG: helix-turn-helix domain-containing protein [Halodesulfurarchaeum sp.]|nr:helix-turn-helix domain-containing protein [Halodesulfurarchaeum sp.]